MSLPGFYAANSLYQTTNSYRSVSFADLPASPALVLAANLPPRTCNKPWCDFTADLVNAVCLSHCLIDIAIGHVALGIGCALDCMNHYREHRKHCEDSGGCLTEECSYGYCCPAGSTYCGGECHPPCPPGSSFSRLNCKCVSECKPGFTYDWLTERCTCGMTSCSANSPDCCNGKCTNLQSDIDNCGACGVRCLPPKKCINGSCVYSDNCNCGAQYKRCRGDEKCVNGTCQSCGGRMSCGLVNNPRVPGTLIEETCGCGERCVIWPDRSFGGCGPDCT